MKNVFFAWLSCSCALGTLADVVVTNVVATADGVPARRVTVTYEIMDSENSADDIWVMFEGLDRDRGVVVFPQHLTGDGTEGPLAPGTHTTYWDIAEDRPLFHSSAFVVKVTAVRGLAPYHLIAMSGGASSFPILDCPICPRPSGTCTDPAYSSNVWMRLVLPGTFQMGSPPYEKGRDTGETLHSVTLTKPFYLGVVQATRLQWEMVTGQAVVSKSPIRKSNTLDIMARPEDDVSYDMIRGNAKGSAWPDNDDVDETSFMGRLRARTHTGFDLPTEAEWEYACRAGTTTMLNSGKESLHTNACPHVDEIACYQNTRGNGNVSYGGRFQPNGWGLYDMLGNTCEWCLDAPGAFSDKAVTDPLGSSASSQRVCRNMNFSAPAQAVRVARRLGLASSTRWDTSLGFRVREYPALPEGFSFSVETSPMFRVDLRAVGAMDDTLTPQMTVEAGPLAEGMTIWSNDVVHIVRDWVLVPKGSSLKLTAGTEVRFYAGAGIDIRNGGRVDVLGTEDAPVIMGALPGGSGETDFRVLCSRGGVWSSNGYLKTDILAAEKAETLNILDSDTVARIPVPTFGLRPPFTVNWRTVSGTAQAGRDFVDSSGTLTFEGEDVSTRMSEVPLLWQGDYAECPAFSVEFHIVGPGIDETITRTVTLSKTGMMSPREIRAGEETVSSSFRLDTRQVGQTLPVTAGAALSVAYSTAWDGAAGLARVEETVQAGASKTLAEGTDGVTTWRPGAGAGLYTLTHRTENGELTARIAVLGDACEIVESRTIDGDERWSADKVYIVNGRLVVADGAQLVIPSGTVVKFADDASLTICEKGLCVAAGVTFTHLNDDSVGGDTLGDGRATVPVHGRYSLSGVLADDATTVYRYLGAIALDQNIVTDMTLRRGATYVMRGAVMVTNATLTVSPGVVIKSKKGVGYLSAGKDGRIVARGTRAEPIYFTSVHDDAHGGDTDGNGSAISPQPGDWMFLGCRGGVLDLEHCHILYGGEGGMRGALFMYGQPGEIRFSNGEIAHCAYDAVGVETGKCTVVNSVIHDALAAFRHYTREPIVNCVIYDCGRITQGGSHQFRNCVFSEITEVWQAFGLSTGAFRNCCFWNKAGSSLTGDITGKNNIVTQDAMNICGRNGNIWGDPCFVDPANGDFRITSESVCVDAADGALAPSKDIHGQPRVTLRKTPSGTPSENGAVPDIGVSEVMPRQIASGVDLAARSVSAEAIAVPGQSLTFKWEIADLGGAGAAETWRDTLSLVSEDGLREVTLGDHVTRSIEAGGTVICTASFVIPPMDEGKWYPKVNVNSYRDIFEGSLTTNNVAKGTGSVSVEIETFDACEVCKGSLVGGTPSVVKLTFDPVNANRMVRLKVPENVTAQWGFGFLPTSDRSSGSMTSSGSDILFRIPDNATAVYVLLESADSTTYEISFEDTKVSVTGVSPDMLPSNGKVTITIDGAGFTADSKVYLVDGATQIAPESVQYVSARQLVATIDCTKLKAGNQYDVSVVGEGNTATAKGAISTIAALGKGEFWAKLIVPSAVRQGRKCICCVEYGNSGTADVEMPMMRVDVAGGGRIGRKNEDAKHEFLYYLAAGDGSTASVLRPGYTGRIQFVLLAGAENELLLSSSNKRLAHEQSVSYDGYSLAAIAAAAARVAKRGGDPTDYVAVVNMAENTVTNAELGCLTGLVQTQGGQAVAGAVVECSGATMCVMARTDDSGRYCIEPLPPETYRLAVRSHMVIQDPEPIVVAAGRDTLVETIIVSNGYSLVVNLLTGSSDAVSVTAERFCADDVLRDSMLPVWQTPSNAVFSGLCAGEYVVSCSCDDGVKVQRSVDVGETAVVVCDIDALSRSSVMVRLAKSEPDDCVSVFLLDDEDLVRSLMQTNASDFIFVDLPDGAYTLVVMDGTGTSCLAVERFSVDHVLKPDQALTVTCDAPMSGELRTAKPAAARFTMSLSAGYDIDEIDNKTEKLLKRIKKILNRPLTPPQGKYDCEHNQKQYKNYKSLVSDLKDYQSVLQQELYAYNAGYWLNVAANMEVFLVGTQKAAEAVLTAALVKVLGPNAGIAAGQIAGSAWGAVQNAFLRKADKGAWSDDEGIRIVMETIVDNAPGFESLSTAKEFYNYFSISLKKSQAATKMEKAAAVLNKYYSSAEKLANQLDVLLTSNGPRYFLDDCQDKKNDLGHEDRKTPQTPVSNDPNEIVGPMGRGGAPGGRWRRMDDLYDLLRKQG